MTLPQVVDMIQAMSNSGVYPDSSRFDQLFIEDTIHKARASVLMDYFSKTKRINPIWTQQYTAKFDINLQDDPCLRRFRVPSVLTLDVFYDGFMYVGTIEGNCQYTKINNRAALANTESNRYTKLQEDQVKFIYSDGFIECYGNKELEDLRIDGIFLNPTDVPTYNKDIDEYPLDEALILQMQGLLFGAEISKEISQPFKVKGQTESK